MQDLCEMINDEDYRGLNRDDSGGFDDDGWGGEAVAFGMGMGIAGENQLAGHELAEGLDVSPEEILQDYEESIKKVSLKDRTVEVPAFERYVYERCGVKV